MKCHKDQSMHLASTSTTYNVAHVLKLRPTVATLSKT